MDPYAFEPGDIGALEAGVGDAYRSSHDSRDYESAVFVGEPVVPNPRQIIVAVPDVLANIHNRRLVGCGCLPNLDTIRSRFLWRMLDRRQVLQSQQQEGSPYYVSFQSHAEGWIAMNLAARKQGSNRIMTERPRKKKGAGEARIDKEFRRIAEKNLRKDRELLEKLAKI